MQNRIQQCMIQFFHLTVIHEQKKKRKKKAMDITHYTNQNMEIHKATN